MAISVEKKVGFFFIFCLVILGGMLEVGEKWNPFEKQVPYRTYLGSVTGLKIGDPVRLAGVDVGRIKQIKVLEDKVQIDFEVKPGTRIKTDTVAGLRLTNLLGGQFLGLSLGSPSAPLLPPGETVRGKESANIDIIVDNVSDLTKDAKVLISQLNANQNEVMHKISAMLDENRGNLRDAIANFDSITGKMDRGEGSLAMLLNDKALYANARDATAELRDVSAKINRGEGTMGKLVNDDAIYKDARNTLATINDGMKDVKEIAGKINRGEGTLGKLVNDDSLYKEAKGALTNIGDGFKDVKEIAGKINRGEGTLGKLVNDDSLYRDTSAAMKKVERAADGLADSGPISVLGSIIGTLF
jgi:phospholipid/cholesterol/gamma-HCH transport system substrate-binding protein